MRNVTVLSVSPCPVKEMIEPVCPVIRGQPIEILADKFCRYIADMNICRW